MDLKVQKVIVVQKQSCTTVNPEVDSEVRDIMFKLHQFSEPGLQKTIKQRQKRANSLIKCMVMATVRISGI